MNRFVGAAGIEKTAGFLWSTRWFYEASLLFFLGKERRNIGSHKRAFFQVQTGKIEGFKFETQHLHDIINLPHHVSANHPRMSMRDRVAQFAPFATLVGYDDAVAETARLTEFRSELDEQEQQGLNARLCELADYIQEHPEVRIRYFVPDERKSGGAIVEICGTVKKLVPADNTIVLTNGTIIPISGIVGL